MNKVVFVALIALALLVGIGAAPFSGIVVQRAVSGTPPAAGGQTTTTASNLALSPAFGFMFLFVGTASCSLDTGVCTATIVNTGTNSSYDLKVDGCHMDIITYHNDFYSTYSSFGGTVGGFVANRLPAGGVATAACILPTTLLTSEPSGQSATGSFTMELINRLYSNPPGKNASVGFDGTWIASPALATTTSTVTLPNLTITTTSTVISTTTATATTTATPGSGLGYPYLLLAALVIVVLLLASYLVGQRYPVRRAQR